jgi:hypothetical protein
VHASFVEEAAQNGGGIRTTAAAFHAPTLERGALKRVTLIGIYSKRRDGDGALRLSLVAVVPPA